MIKIIIGEVCTKKQRKYKTEVNCPIDNIKKSGNKIASENKKNVELF